MRNKLLLSFFVVFCLLLGGVESSAFCKQGYSVAHKNGFYIVKVDLNKSRIAPYVSEKLETVETIAKKTGANVVINTGFFDARNSKTVSAIYSDGSLLANPKENENLLNNEELKPHLKEIFNRGELRILFCKNRMDAQIAYADMPVENNCRIINSTQAGPVILPNMDLEKEFFVAKQDGIITRDSIGAYRKTSRSFVALKGNALYFMITDENSQMTLLELQQKLKKMKFESALGFDGGGSVSLFVCKDDGSVFYQSREKNNTFRPIKSALLVY